MGIDLAWVARAKRAVAGVLGDRCITCGAPGLWTWELKEWGGSPPPGLCVLQVGHPRGRKWSIRRPSRDTKWGRYLLEAMSGKLIAQCGPCNRRDGGKRRYSVVDRTRQGGRRKT